MKWISCTLIILLASASACSASRQQQSIEPAAERARSTPCINLNTASSEDIESLPGIGQTLAQKIVEHRERYGPFKRPQEIIIIDGLSERKYREIADKICVE
jgi:competence protein ComEA